MAEQAGPAGGRGGRSCALRAPARTTHGGASRHQLQREREFTSSRRGRRRTVRRAGAGDRAGDALFGAEPARAPATSGRRGGSLPRVGGRGEREPVSEGKAINSAASGLAFDSSFVVRGPSTSLRTTPPGGVVISWSVSVNSRTAGRGGVGPCGALERGAGRAMLCLPRSPPGPPRLRGGGGSAASAWWYRGEWVVLEGNNDQRLGVGAGVRLQLRDSGSFDFAQDDTRGGSAETGRDRG